MDKRIVAGLLISGAIIVAATMMIYFSPTQACIREWKAKGMDDDGARYTCLPHPSN